MAKRRRRRIDRLFDEAEEQKKTSDAAMAKSAAARKRADHFRHSWLTVYPDAINARTLEPTILRFRGLAELIEERFWDFLISEMLQEGIRERSIAAALFILGHACARDDEALRESLERLERAPLSVPVQHGDLLDILEYRLPRSITVPNTPPLSQTDLADILGVTYDSLRWAIVSGQWLVHPDDRVKHKRPRRWQHKLDDQQREALRKIREKCPEKLWACLDDVE